MIKTPIPIQEEDNDPIIEENDKKEDNSPENNEKVKQPESPVKSSTKSPNKRRVVEYYLQKQKELYTNLYQLHKNEFDKQEFDFCWKQTLEVYRPPGSLPVTVHSPGCHDLFGGHCKRQLVNHFPNIRCLTTKVGLLKYFLH